MPDFNYKEKRFEQDIEEYLTTYGGYQKGNPTTFNREKALDTGTFLSFTREGEVFSPNSAARSSGHIT